MASTFEQQTSSVTTHRKTLRSWLSFCVCVSVMAVIWLMVLPSLSHHPALQVEIRNRRAQKIDADAMFYTDLEMMDDVLERIDNFHHTHPDALWLPSRLEENDHRN